MKTLSFFITNTILVLLATCSLLLAQGQNWEPQLATIMTRWAEDVSPDSVLPEYPRPQLVRDQWKNLNGLWEYTSLNEDRTPQFGTSLDSSILVPFAVESALSGVMKHHERIVYRREFSIPEDWNGKNILLHFGAVDWQATIYVNGEEVGDHKGGYDSFTFDITKVLKNSGLQELMVKVYDPTSDGNQPRGKQVNNPRGIWYTPVTGIWQTVWLEPVAKTHIKSLGITTDIDKEVLHLDVSGNRTNEPVTLKALVKSAGKTINSAEVSLEPGENMTVDTEMAISVPEPHLWSPSDPYLYDLEVILEQDGEVIDRVSSYFGMRKIEVKKDENGKAKIYLNNEFVFQFGPLDQGYWPDGLYTAPMDDALRYDVEITKELGFNMTRKHVKIEPARWYYWCDKLGLLVWQDMPSGDNETPESRKQFETELRQMVNQFRNHPSIIAWVVFNEGWGQFDAVRLTEKVKEWDPTRLAVDASGWQHMDAGDVIDIHRYPGPVGMEPEGDRASILGEYGGVGYVYQNHTWAGKGWGYQAEMKTTDELTARYEQLVKRMHLYARQHNMGAGIYTQITDLETEVNGLLTYDRNVIKMPEERVAAVNKGITPLILPEEREFVNEVMVSLENWDDNTDIRYTINGNDPTANSEIYSEPLMVNKNTTVKARAFKDGEPVGPVTERIYTKVPGKKAQDFANLESGLLYKYFESYLDRDRFKTHWVLRRHLGQGGVLDPVKEAVVETISLDTRERDSLFAFIYDGYIRVPEDGVYTFYISADDDAKISIDGEQITDRMGQSPRMAYESSRVALQKGIHRIEVSYFQAYGQSGLEIQYEGPGIHKQLIPPSVLFHKSD